MAALQRTNLNASLTPELERFVTTRVASDRYQTESEVVSASELRQCCAHGR
jgi:Arc/MetJ-type ribon-helix-helix transcriptional regulator